MEYTKEVQFIETTYREIKWRGYSRPPYTKQFKKTTVFLEHTYEVLQKLKPNELSEILRGTIIDNKSKEKLLTVTYLLPKKEDNGKNRKPSRVHT